MRVFLAAALSALVLFSFPSPPLRAAPLDPAVFRSLREDSTLRDVFFVDAENGWAVGDRGAIWHTADGGRAWRLQESGIAGTLSAVWFVDERRGWAGGSEYHPYTPGSTGVLLHTRDGGQSWQRDPNLMLPGLRSLRFFNANQGWAWGESSALFPSGVFATDDGGRSWSPVSGGGVQDWSAGDFLNPDVGIVSGSNGSLAAVRRRAVEATRVSDVGVRNIRRIKLAAPHQGWLVGDGGLVMHSGDAGRSWQSPPGDVRSLATDEFDLRALEVRGPAIWAAGAPGSRVLFSPDQGTTWQSLRTGQTLPIEDLAFANDRQGWAVGAFGMILATRDGGRTWQRQRGSGTRATVLAIMSEPSAAPLEMLARLSGNEGYLSAVEFLNRRDLEPGGLSFAAQHDRASAAVAACGAAGAETSWRFPLRQYGIDRSPARWLAGWNRVNDGQAMARLEVHLVRQIRQWRPEIVVTHSASLRGDNPLGHTINQIVLHAVELAADATRHAEQSAQFGLEPWRVRKVFGALPDGQLGTVNLTTSQLTPRLGASVADFVQTPHGWLDAEYRPAPATLGFQLLVDTLPQGTGQQDFLSGLNLAPGGDARRLLADTPDTSIELMRRLAQKHRNLQAILTHSDRPEGDSARLLAELGQLTAGLDPRAAGDVLFQLAHHYAQRGQWEAAAETMQQIASHHADHDLARAALTWLLQCHASGEIGWQIKRRAAALQGIDFEAAQAERGVAAARQIEHQHPLWCTDPRVQFPLAVAQRRRGAAADADKIMQDFVRGRPDDAWRASAGGEEWLAEPGKGACPKTVATIARTATKPRLDGVLDDTVWQTAKPLELRSRGDDDSAWPAIALLAYDDEFFYLAASCRRPSAVEPVDRTQPRPRDPDLAARDRVELLLDVDRDYGTYYRFTVDDRGWAAERCWLDARWNPQWFVASRGDDNTWTVEAAIPWAELVEKAPAPRTAWGMQLQRIVPDAGFQSWTTPASTSIMPEGFGYAIFE